MSLQDPDSSRNRPKWTTSAEDRVDGQATLVIERITEVIGDIDRHQSSIASAVEEQTATTSEMSRSIEDVSAGVDDMSRRAQSSSSSTNSVTTHAEHVVGVGSQVHDQAELRSIAGGFRIA